MQYNLKNPVTVGDKVIESVTIKEKWLAGDYIDVQDAGSGNGTIGCRQVSLAIDWPDPQVRLLSVVDYQEILKISNDFFTRSLTPGKPNT